MLAVLHLSTALPKPSAARALKPAAQMDATLVTELNSGGWLGPTFTELESEAPFEALYGWKCPADMPYAYSGGVNCCSEDVDFQAESCTGTTSRCPSGQTRTKMDMCSPVPSTGSPGCAGWCDNHTTSWEWKCFWSAGVCSTCDECTEWNAPVGPRCEPWCERHTKDWTTKCSWKFEQCATCDGCIALQPSFPPSPYTPPVPSTPPPPLAPSPSPPPPWVYSSAICRSQHHADTFFKNPHLDDCPVGDDGLLMCSQATTVGTLCYYSVGNSCGAAAEAPLQPYSCCVSGNKDATCNNGNVILQVAIPPPSPSSPPPPPYTPPPASFWGAGDPAGLNLHLISKVSWAPTCASRNATYNKHQKFYINMGLKTWTECMQLAAEYEMQVNGEAGNSNIYPTWSPIITSDGASAYGYSGTWATPRKVEIWNKFYCTLTKNSFGTYPEYKNAYLNDAYLNTYLNHTSSWLSAQVAFPMRAGPLPCKGANYWNTDSPCTWNQCMSFKYVDVGVVTPYMCQIIAASNGASVLSASTLGLGNIRTALPSFHSCNTVWYWDGTKPISTQPNTVAAAQGLRWDGSEGPPFQCYIGYLDHLC